MKISKILAKASVIAAVSVLMTSCLGENNDDLKENITFTHYLNAVFDSQQQTPTYYTEMGYEALYNLTQNTVDLSIAKLELPNANYTTLSLPALSFASVNGWRTVDARDVKAESASTAPTFDTFYFGLLQRWLPAMNNAYLPCTKMKFTTGAYTVVSLPVASFCVGKTVVTAADGSVYEQELSPTSSVYAVSLYATDKLTDQNDPKNRMASISIKGAQFASNMRALDMQFDSIPYNVTPAGIVELDLPDTLIPSVLMNGKKVPNPTTPISNLKCAFSSDNYMRLNFTCTMLDKDGNLRGTYDAAVSCDVPTAKE